MDRANLPVANNPISNPIHQHYTYTMAFNCVRKVVNMEPRCNLKEQKVIKERQGEKAYWEDNNSDYLAFVGDDLCIFIKTINSDCTLRASSATADRQFELIDIVNPADLGLQQNVAHIVTGEVKDFVTNKAVVSVSTVKNTITKMRRDFITMIMDRDTTVEDKVTKVIQHFDEAEATIREQEMKISKEVQFTDWLFHKLEDVLVPLGFVVEPECENKAVFPSISEYSTSISDCLIYHNNAYCHSIVSGASLMIEDLPSDPISDNIRHLDDTRDFLGSDVFQLYGQVLEVKVKHLNQAALNQCCYNMFGSATRLVTMTLRMGKIVNNTIMYGLVSAMDDRSTVRILRMEIDFVRAECCFVVLAGKYHFMDGLNMVLYKLLSM